MAIKISNSVLSERGLFHSFKSAPIVTITFKIKRTVYEILRSFKRKKILKKLSSFKVSPPDKINLGSNLNSNNISLFANQFKTEKFTFINDFFCPDTFDSLSNSFPHEVFFNYPKNGSKFYSWSDESRWCNSKDKKLMKRPSREFLEIYPTYQKLYDFLDSEEMSEKVKSITNSSEASLYSIALSRAQEGSFLSPHIDTITTPENLKPGEKVMMNFIYFLLAGGSTPEKSGGTGLYLDNEFKKPIFIPSPLRNSALLYDSIEQFYHGFDLMAPGSFRWAIVFQFKIS